MCKFCENNYQEGIKELETNDSDMIAQVISGSPIQLRKKTACIQVFSEKLNKLSEINIKYCPMCGKLLV